MRRSTAFAALVTVFFVAGTVPAHAGEAKENYQNGFAIGDAKCGKLCGIGAGIVNALSGGKLEDAANKKKEAAAASASATGQVPGGGAVPATNGTPSSDYGGPNPYGTPNQGGSRGGASSGIDQIPYPQSSGGTGQVDADASDGDKGSFDYVTRDGGSSDGKDDSQDPQGVVNPRGIKIPNVDVGRAVTGTGISEALARERARLKLGKIPLPKDEPVEGGGGSAGGGLPPGGGEDAEGSRPSASGVPFDERGIAMPNVARDGNAQAKERSAAYLNSAETKNKMGDFAGVVEDADRSLQSFANARAYTLKAVALGRLAGKARDAQSRTSLFQRSEEAALAAVRLVRDNPAAREAAAWAQLNLGRYQDAVASATEALRLNPNSAMAHAIRAYALEGLGRREEMLADIEEAARLDPTRFGEQLRAARAGEKLFDARGDDSWQLFDAMTGRRHGGGASGAVYAGALLLALLLVAGGAWLLWGRRAAAPAGAGLSAARAADDDTSGLLAGKYQLSRIIGKGGMGQVWEAQDQSLDRIVAVKKMSIGGEFEGKARELYLKEARTLAALHHPNIVDIYEILDLPNGLYLVFELLTGKTVQQMLAEQKRLPFKQSREILRPVCEALDFAHGRAVVHRDLKPSNIMVTEQGFVKVMDFGIARSIGEKGATQPPSPLGAAPSPLLMARTQTVAGTPAYMAPEAAGGVVSPAADVYALGVCLYEMVTGELPFGLQGVLSKQDKTWVKASLRVPGLSPEIDDLLARSMTLRIEDRLKNAREFRAALEAVRENTSLA
ncbi:MAG: protein kinase [Elusimicrobiota bacterium]|jgi:tetratricopeptide (TPR) repeat protein